MPQTYFGSAPYTWEKFSRIKVEKLTEQQKQQAVAYELCNSFQRCKCDSQCKWAVIPK